MAPPGPTCRGIVGSVIGRMAPREAAAIRAAVQRVIPSDDGPGALEAGTADYVLGRARATPSILDGYRRLADRLAEFTARTGPGTGFETLPVNAQDAALTALESEGDPDFRRLVIDSMEGFYGDPSHGGNAGGVSWALIGFPGPTGGTGYLPPLGWYDATVEDGA
jgi:gluconate 2-dehydrogenase gamma chain